jgi:tetrahydromethanopterin S-methyltransferase subunit G
MSHKNDKLDKLLEKMDKMQNDLQDMKNVNQEEFDKINNRIDKIENRLDSLENKVEQGFMETKTAIRELNKTQSRIIESLKLMGHDIQNNKRHIQAIENGKSYIKYMNEEDLMVRESKLLKMDQDNDQDESS